MFYIYYERDKLLKRRIAIIYLIEIWYGNNKKIDKKINDGITLVFQRG